MFSRLKNPNHKGGSLMIRVWSLGCIWYADRTGQDRTGSDMMGQNRTGQDMTEQVSKVW